MVEEQYPKPHVWQVRKNFDAATHADKEDRKYGENAARATALTGIGLELIASAAYVATHFHDVSLIGVVALAIGTVVDYAVAFGPVKKNSTGYNMRRNEYLSSIPAF